MVTNLYFEFNLGSRQKKEINMDYNALSHGKKRSTTDDFNSLNHGGNLDRNIYILF